MVLESLWWVPTAVTAAADTGRAAAPSPPVHDSAPGELARVLIGVHDSPTSLLRQAPTGRQPAISRPLRASAREVTASPRSFARTLASPTPDHASTWPPTVPARTPPSAVRTRQSTPWPDACVTSPSSYRLNPFEPPRNILISQPPQLALPPPPCPPRHRPLDGELGRGSPCPPVRSGPPTARRSGPPLASGRGPRGSHRPRGRSA